MALTDIYLSAYTPPTCETGIFSSYKGDYIYQTAILHIPAGTTLAYQAAEDWKRFTHIQEFAPTVISGIQAEKAAHSPLYDLQGRKLQQKPSKGMYIQGGKKVLVK